MGYFFLKLYQYNDCIISTVVWYHNISSHIASSMHLNISSSLRHYSNKPFANVVCWLLRYRIFLWHTSHTQIPQRLLITANTLFQKPKCSVVLHRAWCHHQMETFSALLAICAGNSPVPSEFPTQRPVTQSFDVYFDLRLNKRLSTQSWGWWFEMLWCPLWRHCNGLAVSLSFCVLSFKTPEWLRKN